MSESCCISFKQVIPECVFEFLHLLRGKAITHLNDIMKVEYRFSPLAKCPTNNRGRLEVYNEIRDSFNYWFSTIFSYKWFYSKEYKILGVVGLPTELQSDFDKTIVFQDYTDQDYERSMWEGIELFEYLYDYYMSGNKNEVHFDMLISEEQEAYNRRTLAYNQIQKYVNSWFDSDSEICVSIFNYVDMSLYALKAFNTCWEMLHKDE